MKKLFGGGKGKNKPNVSNEDPPAPAPVPTPIHAKLATTGGYLTKPSPQQKQQQRLLEAQASPPLQPPPSGSPTARNHPDDTDRWEVVTPYIVDSSGQKQVPPTIPVSRNSSYSSIPPPQPIPGRPSSPSASLQSNRPQYTQPPSKKQTPTAPVALGILSALDPPREQRQQQQPQQRAYPDERYIAPDRHSISDANHHPPPPNSREEKKEKRGFWSRDRPKENGRDNPPPAADRGREHRRDQEDPVNDLTRRIGYLTATASEDFSLVYDVCDRASASEANAKEAVRALRREFKYGEPSAQLSAARLWAIMLHNSSPVFVIQSRSRKFMDTIEELLMSDRTSPVVKDRLLDVVGAAAYATRHHSRPDGFQALWRRVKPADKPIEGVPFDTEDAMFNPAPSSRLSQYEVPYSTQPSPIPPQHHHRDPSSRTPPPPVNPPRKRKSPTRNRIIPVEEDIRRLLQECKIGQGNASLLSEALSACRPEEVQSSEIINEFIMKCRSSQELIFAQIPWATAQAEKSRLARDMENEARQRTLSNDSQQNGKPPKDDETVEEKLLASLLASNAELIEAFAQYDDLIRLAEEKKAEERSRKETRMDRRERDLIARSERRGESGGSSPSPSIRSYSPSRGSNFSHSRPQPHPAHQQGQQHYQHHQQPSYHGHGEYEVDYHSNPHAALAPPPNAPHGPRSPGQFSIRSRTPSPSIGSQHDMQQYTATPTNGHGGHYGRGHGHGYSISQDHGLNNNTYAQHPQQHQQQYAQGGAGTGATGAGAHQYNPYQQEDSHSAYNAYDQRSSYERESAYGDDALEDGTPVRPSAKALGKRRAADDGPIEDTQSALDDSYLDENGEVNLDDPRFQLDANLPSDSDDDASLLDDPTDPTHPHPRPRRRKGAHPPWPAQPVTYVYDAAAERAAARMQEAKAQAAAAAAAAAEVGKGKGGQGAGGRREEVVQNGIAY